MKKYYKNALFNFFYLISLFVIFVDAEIRNFDGFIEANYSVIHYSEGFLSTPGYVDASGLVFTTASESAHLSVGSDTWEFFGDDGTSTTRSEESEDDQIRRLDNDIESTEVELILFHEVRIYETLLLYDLFAIS